MTINKTIPVSLCMLLSFSAFAADNTAPVMMDASPCLALTRAIDRLTCFEDQAKAAQQPGTSIPQENLPVVSIPRASRQARQAQPQPAPEAPQTADTADTNTADSFEADFGLPEERIKEKKEKAKANELIAIVADVKELNPHRWLITLENGHVWEQMETRRFELAAGDEVRIYPSRWGNSYRLASQSHKGFIQVKRLR